MASATRARPGADSEVVLRLTCNQSCTVIVESNNGVPALRLSGQNVCPGWKFTVTLCQRTKVGSPTDEFAKKNIVHKGRQKHDYICQILVNIGIIMVTG